MKYKINIIDHDRLIEYSLKRAKTFEVHNLWAISSMRFSQEITRAVLESVDRLNGSGLDKFHFIETNFLYEEKDMNSSCGTCPEKMELKATYLIVEKIIEIEEDKDA